ncbi:hypothetical protein U9M48_021578 [Paspalum notatum var. saurae]|uniref:Uncharacterized protein n=1 Tax=Paspalum notatum var. saurae TaxID=547442 RepID=A0AAQ3THW4_PASNO
MEGPAGARPVKKDMHGSEVEDEDEDRAWSAADEGGSICRDVHDGQAAPPIDPRVDDDRRTHLARTHGARRGRAMT